MSSKNPYSSDNIRLESSKIKIWLLFFVISAIYGIIVLVVITSANISESMKLLTIYSYAIIAPIFTYVIWLLFYHWNAKKWPQNEEMFGSSRRYLILFFLIGVCVINWAAYWNAGIDSIWLIIAVLVYFFTGNELAMLIIYLIGAYAITPALVEEFNKSLPSILAFFVVLQRSKDPNQKNKGMLGNEFNGFLIGILIGLAFESIETASYIVLTILAGGTPMDVYIQVTLRNWGPIHILGGALGGYAAGRAERLRFELGEENFPLKVQIKMFIKRFVPIWLIPVSLHFLWNSSSVWIFLIFFMALNIQDEFLYLLASIITLLALSVISYIFLFIFYKRAHNAAEKTYRCPDTGMFVIYQGATCNDISDVITNHDRGLTEEGSTTNLNYCTNCGAVRILNANFCTNCGMRYEPYFKIVKPISLYEGYTKALFIISMIAGIVYLIFSIGVFILLLFVLGTIAWAYFFIESIREILTGILIIYTAFTLLKLRKEYNGQKSMWGWLFLVYNLIGMAGTLLFMSIFVFIIMMVIEGAMVLFFLAQGMIVGAVFIIVFLIKEVRIEKQLLHYQRWF